MSPRLVVTACAVLLLSACGTSAAAPPAAPVVEAGGPTALTGHSVEFDDEDLGELRWLHEVEGGPNDLLTTDVGRTVDGALHVEPKVSAWFERLRAPYLFREVEGDVLMVARVRAAGRDTPVPEEPYSLAGLMLKAPGAGADWAFITTGTGAGGRAQLEVKTTRNGHSRLQLLPGAPGWVDLALARVGRKVVSLYRLPGAQWKVGARYDRPDLPTRLQWGVNAYTSWTSAQPRPDLKADVDFVHFYRPHIPAAWIGSEDQQRSDEELVRYLAPDEPAAGR